MAGSESAEIRFEVQLTEQDVIAANRLWLRRHRRSRFGLLSCCFLTLVFGLPGFLRGYAVGGIALFALLGPATFILMSYVMEWILPRSARQTWLNQPGLRLPTSYLAGAGGLAVSQEGYACMFAWAAFLRWAEDAHCMILFNSRRTFLTLPKHCLDEGTDHALRRFLESADVPRF